MLRERKARFPYVNSRISICCPHVTAILHSQANQRWHMPLLVFLFPSQSFGPLGARTTTRTTARTPLFLFLLKRNPESSLNLFLFGKRIQRFFRVLVFTFHLDCLCVGLHKEQVLGVF